MERLSREELLTPINKDVDSGNDTYGQEIMGEKGEKSINSQLHQGTDQRISTGENSNTPNETQSIGNKSTIQLIGHDFGRIQSEPRNLYNLQTAHSKCYGKVDNLSEQRADLLYELVWFVEHC